MLDPVMEVVAEEMERGLVEDLELGRTSVTTPSLHGPSYPGMGGNFIILLGTTMVEGLGV